MMRKPPFVMGNMKFSNREVEIISFVIQRMSSKEIAAILDISHNTVNNHINSIIRKIGGSCRKEIIDFVSNNDCLENFAKSNKTNCGYSINTTSIRTKKYLLKNVFLFSWILIVILYVYDVVK